MPIAVKERVMHAPLATASGLILMGADVPPGGHYEGGARVTISLSGSREEERTLRHHWDALCSGGAVTVPLAEAPWGSAFGALTDGYGVNWYVNIGQPGA